MTDKSPIHPVFSKILDDIVKKAPAETPDPESPVFDERAVTAQAFAMSRLRRIVKTLKEDDSIDLADLMMAMTIVDAVGQYISNFCEMQKRLAEDELKRVPK